MPAATLPPDLHIVVLAAGKGTRMKSALPKVLHRAAGAPLIDHVAGAAESMKPSSIVVVIGHQTEQLREHFARRSDVTLALQEPQLGTGHALLQAEPFLRGKTGTVLLLSGDVPLLRAETVRALIEHHVSRGAAATVSVVRSTTAIAYHVHSSQVTHDKKMGIASASLTGQPPLRPAAATRSARPGC